MNKCKKCFALVLVVCLIFSLLSCDKKIQPDSGQEKVGEQKKIQIGITFDSFVIERWEREKDVFVSIAKELGAEVNVQSATGDIVSQKNQIDYFIEKKVDVIVIVCRDSDGIRENVEKALESGIHVIAYDRLITNVPVDLYISFDNEAVGTMMGKALIDKNIGEKSNVLMLGGPLTDNNVTLVEDGFKKVMKEKNVNILDSIHVDNWNAEIARDYIFEHLDTVMKTDAIMCGNDSIASQVIHALAEQRQAGNILVVGQDADLEACQCIVEGTQLMTVYKPVERLAKLAAEYAVILGRGDSIPSTDTVSLINGSYLVPYVKLDPISVTEENMNKVIISEGFHLKEDVYLNVPHKMPK